MKITLKDGSVKEYSQPMQIIDIAKDLSEGLARVACVGEIDGETADLRTVVDKDCTLNILTFDDQRGKNAYRHTASHVLAEAVSAFIPRQNVQSDLQSTKDFTMISISHPLTARHLTSSRLR